MMVLEVLTQNRVEIESKSTPQGGVAKYPPGMTYNIYSDGIDMVLAFAPKPVVFSGKKQNEDGRK